MAVTHPSQLRFRTSAKELKTRSRVCKQAHSQSSPHGPRLASSAPLWSLLEVTLHWSAEISQGELPSLRTWADVAAPCVETCSQHMIYVLLCHTHGHFLFQRGMRTLGQGRIVHVATVEAERRLDLNPEGLSLMELAMGP